MANSVVRCPRCQCLLQEPSGAPVYQCGGCGATLRAKSRSGDTQDVPGSASPSSRSWLTPPPPQASGDVASTGTPTPDARSSEQQATGTARKHVSGDVTTSSRRQATETRSRPGSGEHATAAQKKEHDHSSTNHDSSEIRRQSEAAERKAISAGVSVNFPGGTKDSQADTENRRKSQVQLPDAATKNHSRDAFTEIKVRPSPPRHEPQAQDLASLRHKILKTVHELKGDLSELFSKSPDLNPTTRHARPPRLPKQEGHASRPAVASALPARARPVVNHHGNATRAVKAGHQVSAAPPRRGLPSRRYRRCRADPCCDDNVQPRTCHHHGRPDCSSCRGHCGRPTRAQQEPSTAKEVKRRPPPRHHCRPVLKGAPFIICSSCFKLVQVPADFAVSTNNMLRKLRCGSCSTVLSYSYRDPGRKKAQQDSMDQFSMDGSEVHGGKGYAPPDPFARFVDGFGPSSYSTTEDERPLRVSRNTSFDTVDGMKGGGRLHRLMGYGSASELLRHSPDLYESFDERTTTPEYDRKGKGVCVHAEDDDDSDDEADSGVLMRSAARGAPWPLPGAVRIKS